MHLIQLKKKLLMLFLIVSGLSNTMKAQVAIGGGDAPASGAILEINSGNSTTTKGGLMIARVKITDLKLLPFVSADDAVLHQGHLVYNVNEDPVKKIKQGLYVWDGQKWNLLAAGEVSVASPWMKIGSSPEQVSVSNEDASYINANIVVGGKDMGVLQTDSQNNDEYASLTVVGTDASINGLTAGAGKSAAPSNTALGVSALAKNDGSENVGVGYSALSVNTTGANNLAVGAYALSSQTTGISNTAVGYKAGSKITGSNNAAVGADTEVYNALANDQINIGNALWGKAGISDNTGNITQTGSLSLGDAKTSDGVALSLNGTWKIDFSSVASTEDGDILVVDENGNIGVSDVTPIKYAHINSSETETYNASSINNGGGNLVTWKATDINNTELVEFVTGSDNAAWRIKEDCFAQLSAFINYLPQSEYPAITSVNIGTSLFPRYADKYTYTYTRNEANALLNIELQLKSGNGDWEVVTLSRGAWTQGERKDANQTILLPQVARPLKKDDQIRLVIKRAYSTNMANAYGLPHGVDGGSPSISTANGVKYSKGIRIVVL